MVFDTRSQFSWPIGEWDKYVIIFSVGNSSSSILKIEKKDDVKDFTVDNMKITG